MTSSEIQTVVNLLGAFGIGGLFGAAVTHWLTMRREHMAWVRDNKKLEWREMIDSLREALRVMAWRYDDEMPWPARPGDQQRYREETIRKGEVIIRDRIFISGKLRQSGIFDNWVELVRECAEADVSFSARPKTYPLFEKKAHSFQDDLIRAAREDLGVD